MRASQVSSQPTSGSSPEEIMRKMFLRWINFRLDSSAPPGWVPLKDLRDLLRTENLVRLTELCTGESVPGAIVVNPRPENHDDNIRACITALEPHTRLEWGAEKLIKGVQSKQMGFIEILCWHLVEVAELKKMGLPIGQESNAALAKAVEERLGKFIKLKQFHFRYTKEMIFDIVHDCTAWSPSPSANDVQNLQSAFDNISHWGTAQLVDPPDVHHMGSVNERGFLFFFAMFIPSLEGWAGPKKNTAPPVPSVDLEELERLRRALASAEQREAQALAQNGTLTGELAQRNQELSTLRSQLSAAQTASAGETRALLTQLEQAKATAATESKARAELAQRLRELEGLSAASGDQVRDRDAIIKRLKQDKVEMQATSTKEIQALLHQLDLANANTVAENKGRHDLYAKSKELQDRFTAQIKERDVTIDRLTHEQAELNDTLKKLQTQMRTKGQQFSASVEEADTFKSQLIKAQEDLQDVQYELRVVKENYEASQKNLAALQGEAATCHEEKEQLVRARSTLTDDLSRTKAILADTEARLAASEADKSALQTRLERQDFQGLDARMSKLMASFKETEENLKMQHAENERLNRAMRALELKIPLFARQGKNNVPPPTGDVTLVFTDVEGSTVQWEWDPETMSTAIRVHNDLMRTKLQEWGGYEVKTEGDAFMIAFQDPMTAMSWCLDVQESLLTAKWPEKLYEHKKSAIVYSESGLLLYRGLRVRMGVHCGNPSAEEDPVTGRMDYFGQMVNRSARVESVANGGQVVCSRQVYDRVNESLKTSVWKPTDADLGLFDLKGLNDSTHIMQYLPFSLRERVFEAARNAEAELLEEKKKLQEELAALQAKNAELSKKLHSIDDVVAAQQAQAQTLLADVQKAKLAGVPPEALLDALKEQLSAVLEGQTETSGELQKAIAANDELNRAAAEMADRRERLVLESVALEKQGMQAQISSLRGEVEALKRAKALLEEQVKDLQGEIAVTKAQGGTAEDQLAEARRQTGNLEREVVQLKEQLSKGDASTKELQDEITSLRSLLDAMAKRIEMLEVQLETAEAKTLKMAAFYKQQSDNWVQEESELKKNIRDLEDRLLKRSAASDKAEQDVRLELVELKQYCRTLEQKLREKDPLYRPAAGAPSSSVAAEPPVAAAAAVTPVSEPRDLNSRFSSRFGNIISPPATFEATPTETCADCHRSILPKAVTVKAMGKTYHEDCFRCAKCGKHFDEGVRFYEDRGMPLHDECRNL